MATPRGNFAAVPCSAHHSPPLARLRQIIKPEGDVYYYRALQFAKEYRGDGCLLSVWKDFAVWAEWPDDPELLAQHFRIAGAVMGALDELWQWDQYNGWLIRMRKKAAEKKAKQRARAVKGHRTRRRNKLAARRPVVGAVIKRSSRK